MAYLEQELKGKISEMYPEIIVHRLGLTVTFDEGKNGYVITFRRGAEALNTWLEKKDAEECMRGVQCVYLGVQVAQFIKNFEDREIFGRQAA